MSTITKQAVQAVADLKAGYSLGHADVAILNELARIALASLEAEPAIHRWRRVTVEPYGPYPWHYGNFIGFSKSVEGIEDEYFYSAPPAPVSVPDDVSGPLAHAYKELTPTFMRNHIDVFERYGIYPDGSAGIQAMRIALDGMNRRAAMLQGAENAEPPSDNSPVIPDGWVMVPEEPTHEMLEAGDEQFGTYDVYRRMIAASPQQK